MLPEIAAEKLDKDGQAMVEYWRIEYRYERKEYRISSLREFGSPAESPNGVGYGKVRPGAKNSPKSDK